MDDKNRDSLISMMAKNSKDKGFVCLEIGVWTGVFSQRILKEVNVDRLYLVDPWFFSPSLLKICIPPKVYGLDIKIDDVKSQEDMDSIYKAVSKKFDGDSRVRIYRDKSSNVVELFPNDFFDWVYIDGDHTYEGVKKDLELYYAKVKVNGYITGDDWDWDLKDRFPIRDAVNEFIENKGKLIETKNNQFIILKDK